MINQVAPGDVLVVALGEHVPPGHEQGGTRPVVVVGIPERLGNARFRMVVIVPLTTQTGDWARQSPELYPRLPAGSGNIPADSTVLLDNLRSVDASRLRRRLGALSKEAFAAIRSGLEAILAEEPEPPDGFAVAP